MKTKIFDFVKKVFSKGVDHGGRILLLLLYLILGVVFLINLFKINIGCNNEKILEEKSKPKSDFELKEEKINSETEILKREFKAKSEKDLKDYDYTIEYTRTLIDSSNLLIFSSHWYKIDITEEEDKCKYIVRVYSLDLNMLLELECDESMIEKILEEKKNGNIDIIFVTKITKISKLFLSILPGYREESKENYLDIDFSDKHIAKGKVVECRFVQ